MIVHNNHKWQFSRAHTLPPCAVYTAYIEHIVYFEKIAIDNHNVNWYSLYNGIGEGYNRIEKYVDHAGTLTTEEWT